MNQRTIVRSLTTSDGLLLAMNDSTLVWKPGDARATKCGLDGFPTVLLALRGSMGNIDTAVVGTAEGDVLVFTVPRLELICKFRLQSGSIRAITLKDEGHLNFLVGTQHGAIWTLTDNDVERTRLLCSIESPVTSLHLEGSNLHIRSGWIHHEFSWDGATQGAKNIAERFPANGFKRLDRSYVVKPLA